jgi:hypothetical protein
LPWKVYPKKNLHTFRDAFSGPYLRNGVSQKRKTYEGYEKEGI